MTAPTLYRTDENRNPTAFTTDVAAEAGLKLGTDYEQGSAFVVGTQTFHTARLLGLPVALTIQVIDAIGFYTNRGLLRWIYIAIPAFLWAELSPDQKRDVIGFMYENEGGTAMWDLFPNGPNG